MADVPPNQTIYVNNLYEKLSKTGESAKLCWILLCTELFQTLANAFCACRPQKMLVRNILPVREDSGRRCYENIQVEGAGLGCLCRHQLCNKCTPSHARLSLL